VVEFKEPATAFKLAQPAVTKAQRPAVATSAAEPTATVLAALPSDFPTEIPVYEGANLVSTHSMANDARNVLFTVSDPVPVVSRFYRNKLESQGFEVTQQSDRGIHTFTTYKKGDLLINLTVANDDRNPGHQLISVMYEHVKPLPFDEF